MCCLFTCCGWMVDLIQRFWTFTMSCIISSAVCCSLLSASISGIALGYNYSLAEYIDLKETNVSIYLKRGVFDDDISDDLDWRRSGGKPILGHIRDENLLTGSADDELSTLRSGRRLEDSIYRSNDKNNFEDSLMRLTAKPPDFSSTEETRQDMPIGDIVQKYPSDSLEQLKALKSAINMRRMGAGASRSTTVESTKTPYQDIRVVPNFPAVYKSEEQPMRRMQFDAPTYSSPSTISSLRNAVPEGNINDPINWMLPKLFQHAYPNGMDPMYPQYPTPVTPRPGPVRPTRPRIVQLMTQPGPIRSTQSPEHNIPKSIDEEMDTFKEKFMMEKGDFLRNKENELNQKMGKSGKHSDDDYEYEAKGIPLRKKRGVLK